MTTPSPVEQAWSLRLSDPIQAHGLATSALTDSHEHHRAQSVLAHLAWRDGRYAQALEYAEQAETAQRLEHDTLWLTRTLNSLGVVHLYLGQHDVALAVFQEQLTLAQSIHDLDAQAAAYNDLGATINSHDLQQGLHYYHQALQLYQQAAPLYDANRSAVLINLSVLYDQQGETATSHAFLEEAGALALAAQAWPYYAAYVFCRSERLQRQNHFEQARQLIQHALDELFHLPTEHQRDLLFALLLLEEAAGNHTRALKLAQAMEGRWATRRENYGDYLTVRARLEAAHGEYQAAYETQAQLLAYERESHAKEAADKLRTSEVLHRTREAQQQAREAAHIAVALQHHVDELQALRGKLEHLSSTDTLTGLYNRRYFVEQSQAYLQQGIPLAVAYFDIDHFKRINDRVGHAGGDRVLQAVADLLRQYAEPNDLLVRLGGDEFVLVRPDVSTQQLAEEMEGLRQAFVTYAWDTVGPALEVQVSIGVTSIEGDLEGGLVQADQRMYRAKEEGRNRVQSE